MDCDNPLQHKEKERNGYDLRRPINIVRTHKWGAIGAKIRQMRRQTHKSNGHEVRALGLLVILVNHRKEMNYEYFIEFFSLSLFGCDNFV